MKIKTKNITAGGLTGRTLLEDDLSGAVQLLLRHRPGHDRPVEVGGSEVRDLTDGRGRGKRVLGLADDQDDLVLAAFQGVHGFFVGAVVEDEVAAWS